MIRPVAKSAGTDVEGLSNGSATHKRGIQIGGNDGKACCSRGPRKELIRIGGSVESEATGKGGDRLTNNSRNSCKIVLDVFWRETNALTNLLKIPSIAHSTDFNPTVRLQPLELMTALCEAVNQGHRLTHSDVATASSYSATAAAHVTEGTLHLRFDSPEALDFWLEVEIPLREHARLFVPTQSPQGPPVPVSARGRIPGCTLCPLTLTDETTRDSPRFYVKPITNRCQQLSGALLSQASEGAVKLVVQNADVPNFYLEALIHYE